MDPVFEGMLLVRAKYECEYCRRRLSETGWQKEHIWPESRGGTSDQENLAVSCQRCNNNKRDHVEWIDRLTGSSVPLFNPRTMEWAEHFRATHDEIVGISAVGRSSAALLFRSTPPISATRPLLGQNRRSLSKSGSLLLLESPQIQETSKRLQCTLSAVDCPTPAFRRHTA